MLIFPKEKVIFVHIPKTGGTSVRLRLQEVCPDKIELVEDYPPRDKEVLERIFAIKFSVPKHASLADLQKFVPDEELKSFKAFTFVRNPYARALSAYRFIKKRARNGVVQHNGDSYDLTNMTLTEFLNSPLAGVNGKPAAKPQSLWLDGEADFAFVGRTETLQEDMQEIISELKLPLSASVSFGRENSTGTPSDWTKLSHAEKQKIEEVYCGDFERLSYDYFTH